MKFAHPVTLEPEVTGGWYSGLWTLIGCTLCVLSMKTIVSDTFFECVISHGITLLVDLWYVVFVKWMNYSSWMCSCSDKH